MANIAAGGISQTGTTVNPVTACAGGGDAVDNDGRTFLIFKNASGGSLTVTVDSLVPSNYGTDVNVAIVVAAGATVMAGPFDPSRFNDANGRIGLTYSGVTSLTVQAVKG